jgi:hypothetical protein
MQIARASISHRVAVVEVLDRTQKVVAFGMIASARRADDSYTVEVADARTGRFRSAQVSAPDLRIKRVA